MMQRSQISALLTFRGGLFVVRDCLVRCRMFLVLRNWTLERVNLTVDRFCLNKNSKKKIFFISEDSTVRMAHLGGDGYCQAW